MKTLTDAQLYDLAHADLVLDSVLSEVDFLSMTSPAGVLGWIREAIDAMELAVTNITAIMPLPEIRERLGID